MAIHQRLLGGGITVAALPQKLGVTRTVVRGIHFLPATVYFFQRGANFACRVRRMSRVISLTYSRTRL
jgi:hypothetical protein